MHAITRNRIDSIQNRDSLNNLVQNEFMFYPVVPGQAVDQGNWKQQVEFLAPQRVGKMENVPLIETKVNPNDTSKDLSLAGRLLEEARSRQEVSTDYQADSVANTFYQADLSDPNSIFRHNNTNVTKISSFAEPQSRKQKTNKITSFSEPRNPLLSYMPLTTFVKSRISINEDDVYEETKKMNFWMIIFSVIAFIIAYRSNNKCKPINRIAKALIASLFGIFYIFIFIIKYSLQNCD